MAISDPKKPWVIVSQFLGGTQPPGSLINELQVLFAGKQLGGTSIADFWRDQTLGVVDVAQSVVKPWQGSGWEIKNHPGKDGGVSRQSLADHAKGAVGNMGDYRGVIAIYNYNCNAGDVGRDVVFGLGGYGSTPVWADDAWRQCTKCNRMVSLPLQGLACAAGGSHTIRPRSFMTVTDTEVPKLRVVEVCKTCGTLFASDVDARVGVTECPSGGSHTSLLSVNVLAGWPDPPAEREWSVCSWCRSVIPDWASTPCPAHGDGHDHIEKAAIHFPYLEIELEEVSPRGFLCHEMGHAYGFVHGRGLEPRSSDLDNDCWPSAYGDRFDIMSYAGCASFRPTAIDPDAGHGVAGPGLSISHLIAGEIINDGDLYAPSPGPGEPVDEVTLRPVVAAGSVGWAGAKFGPYVAEYRQRRNWDRAIDGSPGPSGVNPGSVLVRYLSGDSREIPNLVPSTLGQPWVGEGESFEPRLGMGNTALFVKSIAPDGSSAVVEFSLLPQQENARSFARWLVIPYRASDSAAGFDRKKTATILAGVERFWTDMAAGAFSESGGRILTPDKDSGGSGSFTLKDNLSSLGQLSASDRASAVVEAALSSPNPADTGKTLTMDWRWFTGLILVSVDGFGDGYAGTMAFDAGVFPHEARCETADNPRRLDKLSYELVELPMSGLTFARLAQEIAPGFSVNDDPYSGMGTDAVAKRYTPPAASAPFGDAAWGPVGPSVSTSELSRRGWLPDNSVHTVVPHGGGGMPPPTVGSVSLSPVFSEKAGRAGVVRAEIGPYAFELRADSGWDRGLGGPIVLAYGIDATPLSAGQQLSWGGPIPEITGGGRVEVTALSNDSATLAYWIMERPIIVAGGGVLHGGGTVLFGADGRIHRIPPGDPAQARASQLIESLEKIRRELPMG
jgi:hypothetical protein